MDWSHMADLCFWEIVKLHGIPKITTSDHASKYLLTVAKFAILQF